MTECLLERLRVGRNVIFRRLTDEKASVLISGEKDAAYAADSGAAVVEEHAQVIAQSAVVQARLSENRLTRGRRSDKHPNTLPTACAIGPAGTCAKCHRER